MSGKIAIIVQARMSSSRLPGKSMLSIGDKPLIYYVLKRLSLVGIPVIVSTSTHPSDNDLVIFVQSLNFPYYRGSLENVLQRYIETAERFDIKNLVRVTGDNPLVDIDYLKRSLAFFEEYEYVDGIYPGGMIKGTGFELVKLSELQNITPTCSDHSEHVTLWLRENMAESSKRIQLDPRPVFSNLKDIVLSCDFAEDLELLRHIFHHFDYRYNMDIPEVLSLLEINPELPQLNKHLH